MRDDVRAARAAGRQMIAAALALPALVGFLWVASPAGPTPMFSERPWYEVALPWIAVCLYVTGVSWMIRIYRTSHLEAETSGWRYRD